MIESFVRPGLTSDIIELTSEHLVLVLTAMSIAIAIGVPARNSADPACGMEDGRCSPSRTCCRPFPAWRCSAS